MIYTVTLNPSIDYIVHVDALTLGQVNRMSKDIKLPGGKGINVSRILNRINHPSTALGFTGGFTGEFIKKWLDTEHIAHDFVPVKEDTRINVKLKGQTETEINGLGPAITHQNIQDLKAQFAHLQKEDLVILSGSKPASLSATFYQELIALIEKSGARFVIDTTGQDLLAALAHRPLLVKPNNHELAELFGTTFTKLSDIFPFGKKLLTLGAEYALISMAGDGALLFTSAGIYQSNVLKRPLKNSVGAGDSMIAGFVGEFANSHDPLEAFKWGVASGSATAFSDDLATGAFIEELLKEVHITKIA